MTMMKVIDKAESVCDLLRKWHDMGKDLPSYERGRGKVFLLEIFENSKFEQGP